jgi:penicillin amidase
VWRDAEGIPHVDASSTHDAFFAQGFVHAHDRLWQMDYDRRRAYGRWSECVGRDGVAADILMRRLRLGASARADYRTVNGETRAMLDSYAMGVNAFIGAAQALPMEFRLLDYRPEPWEPWDGLAVFKVRHAEMGTWRAKVWRARLLQALGADRAAEICPGAQSDPVLIVPPGTQGRLSFATGLAMLTDGAATLAEVNVWGDASNNWAVSGSRTASGKPLVAGDPHRALDVPNVYYQNHLACPDFDVIGLSFPGVPAFPHFGHNQAVAWCVTHTRADYQDLFIEEFDREDWRRYRFRDEWRPAETTRETIQVRDSEPVQVDVVTTHHGSVLLGDPKQGCAISLRYTATAGPNRTAECFLPMMRATGADELEEVLRPWVEPVNNFVYADVDGNIGYRSRGQVPIREAANAWLPVPGSNAEHEWQNAIPFDEMPAVRNPENGFVASANNPVVGSEYPYYIGLDFLPDFRVRRLVERLEVLGEATVADMAMMQRDRTPVSAREWIGLLAKLPVAESPAKRMLLAWDGEMHRDSAAAAVYAVFRERLIRGLMGPILGPLADEAFTAVPGGGLAHMMRLKGRLADMIERDDRTLLPAGTTWPEAVADALDEAMLELERLMGPDRDTWRWGRIHVVRPRHPLARSFPDHAGTLNPPAVPLGGDEDTVQMGAFWGSSDYGVTVTSVARYVFDLGDWDRSLWITPLGVSGDPASPHYADQAAAWADDQLRPMRYGWQRIRSESVSHQVLEPQ